MLHNIIQNLKIESLSHDGRGIGFLPQNSHARGKAVFVAGALPGESVTCSISREKRNFVEAALLEILKGNGVPPLCPHHRVCGGCALQRMAYEKQLAWKKKLLDAALTRIGKLEGDFLNALGSQVQPSPSVMAYRNKVEFAFGINEGRLVCGFRNKSGHDVFNLQYCAVIPETAMAIRERALALANASRLDAFNKGAFWRFLILRYAPDSGKWWIRLLTSPGDGAAHGLVRSLGRKLLADFPEVATFIHEERSRKDLLPITERRICCLDHNGYDNPSASVLFHILHKRTFKLDCANFFQINAGAAQLLAQIARQMDKAGGNLLDLYCGVGAPGQLLGSNHDFTAGMEIDNTAVKFAAANAEGLVNGIWESGDTAKLLPQIASKRKWQTALIDPPRAGMAPKAMRALIEADPQRVIYISCNPATLARDAVTLKNHYLLKQVAAIDMFPHTSHVECASLWVKRPGGQ